jgi:acetylornithine deacetylase/succinyl-diaminopimelate desuccinylase family protein
MVEEQPRTSVTDAVDPDELLRFARALIAAPSENPGGTEDEAVEVAEGILLGLGATTTIVRSDAGRPSVIGRIGDGSRPRLAWNGHLDVVPAGSPDTWTVDPWAGEVVNGRLIGRGAVDMKGSIAAALAAAAAIRRTGMALAGTLEFHLVADEELAGIHGSKVLWERDLLDQDACIVGEASELQLGMAQQGGAWITATAFGTAAHGSQPHLGVNAITTMARFLLRLPEVVPEAEHPLTGRPTVNAAMIAGGSAPNVVPDRCTVDIDRRLSPGERDPAAVLAAFETLADDLRREDPATLLEFEVREWTDAAEAERDARIASIARTAVEAETGRVPHDVGFTGITDARFYLNDAAIPAVVLGPGSLRLAHTADESVALDELLSAARIDAAIFTSFLGS